MSRVPRNGNTEAGANLPGVLSGGGQKEGMGKKYPDVKGGEWVHPAKKGYKMACCDCGLVHVLEFAHIPWGRGRKIVMRAWRDNRATGQMRRHRTVD